MIAGFEFGCHAPLHVRRERAGRAHARSAQGAWRLCYASDLHLTARRAALADRLIDVVVAERPDAVLLGGDLIDRQSGCGVLRECVRRLVALAPVFAVPGNHEAWLGVAAVRAAVLGGGGGWLPDGDAELCRGGRTALHLHGPVPRPASPGLRVLIGHHPGVADAAARAGYDLVLAGHLHGGQCVLWQRGARLYPGAWFSPWNGLRFQLGATTVLVSRGAADTLPVRFRCPREVLLCQVG